MARDIILTHVFGRADDSIATANSLLAQFKAGINLKGERPHHPFVL
jgi:hypothetical protein